MTTRHRGPKRPVTIDVIRNGENYSLIIDGHDVTPFCSEWCVDWEAGMGRAVKITLTVPNPDARFVDESRLIPDPSPSAMQQLPPRTNYV